MGYSYAPSVQVRTGAERATLVRRTYGLVFASILVSMLGVWFTESQDALLNAVGAHPFISWLCTLAPLFMAQRAARDFPKNLILTFLFTFVTGVWLAPMMVAFNTFAPGAVTEAATLTLGAFGVLTLYALVSRRDFSAWGGFFVVGFFILFAALLLNFFLHSAAVGLFLSAIGVIVISGLLVFDTWRIMRSGTYGKDDYVMAAVAIYVDLLNLFMFILSLVGGGRRR
jgi:FtsH-binding integral membrane protein